MGVTVCLQVHASVFVCVWFVGWVYDTSKLVGHLMANSGYAYICKIYKISK